MEDLSTDGFRAPRLAAGQVLAGRFRIVARLGEGAIGEVYEAADLELEEQVAIKVVHPEISRDPEVLHRFRREIQLARRVTHPSVCRTFDLFHHQSEEGVRLDFVTLELLRGETLEARLQREGRLSPAEALPLVVQIAEGLQAAHQAGVVHRDFKSANVMLAPGPGGLRAVVTDFGLAWSSSVSASVTRTGTLVGSPAYMAPEQVRGEAVTPATDIYALGIVLYEMVTGSLPFSADTAIGTAIKRLREPPTLPSRHTPDLDPRWEEVILRCLESDPAERFATPVEVARALEAPRRIRESGSGTDVPRRRRPRWPLAAGVAVMVAGLVVALLAWRMWRPHDTTLPDPDDPGVPRPVVAVFGFENLSGDPAVEYVELSLVRLLPSELAAGERLRLIPREEIKRARQDLSLSGGEDLSPETLARLRTRLGVDFVITGSYFAGRRNSGMIRLTVTIQNAQSGEIVSSLSQDGSEEELIAFVDSLGVQLRERLGVDELSTADELAVRAARPTNAQAARLYAEGLEKLSRFETLQATHLLEQARDADPENALIRADLAAAWSALGWQTRAEESAQEAFRRSTGLGYEPRRRVEARFYETSRQWRQAEAIYEELWNRFPDDLEIGLGLAQVQIRKSDATSARGTVMRLRELPEPWRGDPRIDLAEAEASLNLGNVLTGIDAAKRAERKGETQGAPLVAARALYIQGTALRGLSRLPEALAAAERAEELFRASGDLASAALSLSTIGSVLLQQGELAAARQTFEDVAAIGRSIGSEEIRGLGLINIGTSLAERGDLAGAREYYTEALEICRQIGARRRRAIIAQNLARVDQQLGRRTEARLLLEETAETFRELRDIRNEAMVLANLAAFFLEEGEVQEASAAASRAMDLHKSLYDYSSMADAAGLQGRTLALRGDLPAAQRKLEWSAARFEALGERLWAARQRIELARILVESGRAEAGEALARKALTELGTMPATDDELAARTVLALAALAQGRKEVAAAEAHRAAGPLAACEDQVLQLQSTVAIARIHAATGQARQAAGELRVALAEAERNGLRPLALEARLALGALETGAGEATGRARLREVAQEATVAGYGSLARRAQAALNRAPS